MWLFARIARTDITRHKSRNRRRNSTQRRKEFHRRGPALAKAMARQAQRTQTQYVRLVPQVSPDKSDQFLRKTCKTYKIVVQTDTDEDERRRTRTIMPVDCRAVGCKLSTVDCSTVDCRLSTVVCLSACQQPPAWTQPEWCEQEAVPGPFFAVAFYNAQYISPEMVGCDCTLIAVGDHPLRFLHQVHFFFAAAALVYVLLEFARFRAVKLAVNIHAHKFCSFFTLHHCCFLVIPCCWAYRRSSDLSARLALERRDRTVPTGQPIISAISL